ncbi:hypothetical protein N7495_002591 [Penicillium taxi]|uniref:uncharacterized protein n=1 Tax=Penicillium taxi TaxID=168475 RepID=UPI0025455B83|nr:uncharacterized protein N7495_002591 [Penicillium taxi]KAJ5902063.1 hypothetical protein N7495_002591 [Penicillium taxi]
MATSRTRLSPGTLKQALPLEGAAARSVGQGRDAINRLLSAPFPLEHDYLAPSPKLLVIIGPCSIHDPDAAMDYARRLAVIAERHRGQLLIAMRVYIEKPRSTVGWKGLVHDPDLTQGNGNLAKGLQVSREIMLRVAELGLPVVTEVLSPFVLPFLEDVLACGIIGARTTESQPHREVASDAPMAIGFKNGTDGTLGVALDAMQASAQSHTLVAVDDEGFLIERLSTGNQNTFVVLRGGKSGPNFSRAHIQQAEAAMRKSGQEVRLVVDCSHGNSMKDYRKQPIVAADLAQQIADGMPIAGVMLESNIHAGQQSIATEGLKYGVSITDGCISWEETERVLDNLAAAVKMREASALTQPVPLNLSSLHQSNAKLEPNVSIVELSS